MNKIKKWKKIRIIMGMVIKYYYENREEKGGTFRWLQSQI